MILVTAWLLVDAAMMTGGSPPASAARAHNVATTDSSSVVLPVPGGPLTQVMSPSPPASRCARLSRWAFASG
ncbi:hypothetical protein NHH82_28520 [Oxalobacteraceae bacterium OTU3REALA1]|nr:hypothetical protein NHH82_28520 [Oxalobacteraceae bacterium OTU3REALA1]